MKTAFFVILLAIFVAFLSCSTISTGPSADVVVSCKAAMEQSYEGTDPSCKSDQRKLVYILDLSPKEIDWDYVYSHLPGYVPGSGMVPEIGNSTSSALYNVNGIDMTQEEYEAYREEYTRKYEEELNKHRRDLLIPCAVGNGTAWLTDEEITELKQNYKELAIEDYIELVPSIIKKEHESSGCL
jgi:hypothetical protein